MSPRTSSSRFSRLRALVLELHARSPFCGISSNTCCTPLSPSQRWLNTSTGDSESSTSPDPPLIHARKIVNSRVVGIRSSDITTPTWTVLKILQRKGFETYLVGGCVRDLLLKKAPKDFDVITTASLKQIKKQFRHAIIVGRQFPICQVSLCRSMIEVSSFDTSLKNSNNKQATLPSQMPKGCDLKDFVRWKNCFNRDFTINSLFYDPFGNAIYDYVNGISDLSKSEVHTVVPAHLSFKEDCARILRGIRIAARLGLQFSKETVAAIRDHSSSIATLSKPRLMMELNYMLAYGAAESSILLLQKFKLLDFLLPVHAAYLAGQSREQSGESSIMLLKLFSNVDKLLAADQPSSSILWLSLLAFHLTLVCHPQDALVVRTFSSILYHGTWSEAMLFIGESSEVHVQFIPEIVVPSGAKSVEQLLKESSHFASLVKSSVKNLTQTDALKHSLARYQKPLSCSSLVLVSNKMGETVKDLFDVLATDIKSYSKKREKYDIDYELLKKGNLDETRFVLGKIIMDTMKGEHELTPKPNQSMVVEQRNHLLEFTCEANQTVAAVKKNRSEKATKIQHQKVASGNKKRIHSGRQNKEVITVKKGCESGAIVTKNCLGKTTDAEHQTVAAANKHHGYTGKQNQNVAAVKSSCKIVGDCNLEISATENSHKRNQRVSVAEGSPHKLHRELNKKEIAAGVNPKFSHEKNNDIGKKEKRRLLSALFK